MRLATLLLAIVFVSSCTNINKIPENIISANKMESILWDMIQADRFSALFLQKDSATKNVQLETLKVYEQVFQLHKIAKEDFIRSYKYYLSRPDMVKLVFDSIAVKADRQKALKYSNRPDSLK